MRALTRLVKRNTFLMVYIAVAVTLILIKVWDHA